MTTDTKAIRAKAKMWHLPAGIADDILALCDALDELRAEVLAGSSWPTASPSSAEAMKHLHDIINCGNCSGSRQSARLALRALRAPAQEGGE